GGVDDRDGVGLGVGDQERGRRRRSQPGHDQERHEAEDPGRPHYLSLPDGEAVLSMAVTRTFGGAPRKVNRTASPTETPSVIVGDGVREPIGIGGINPVISPWLRMTAPAPGRIARPPPAPPPPPSPPAGARASATSPRRRSTWRPHCTQPHAPVTMMA